MPRDPNLLIHIEVQAIVAAQHQTGMVNLRFHNEQTGEVQGGQLYAMTAIQVGLQLIEAGIAAQADEHIYKFGLQFGNGTPSVAAGFLETWRRFRDAQTIDLELEPDGL